MYIYIYIIFARTQWVCSETFPLRPTDTPGDLHLHIHAAAGSGHRHKSLSENGAVSPQKKITGIFSHRLTRGE